MKIALYGATGKVARPILDEALARGHEVTAVTRDPSRAPLPSHVNLQVEQGDILIGVTGVVRGHDVVISAIGAPRGSDGGLLIKAAHSLIRGLNGASMRRLLVVGGAGILEVARGVRYLDTPEFPAEARPASSAHLEALKVYSESQLDWTVVSPAAEFKPGERTGRFRKSSGMLIRDKEAKSRISFEDYAIAMVDEAENPKFMRSHMAVGY
jgi:putative NADH-flavin reductase